MTLSELIAAYRVDSNDKVEPYFSLDADVTTWLNEAEREAALRGRLIHEVDDFDVRALSVEAGTSTYTMHEALYELTHIAIRNLGASKRCPILIVSTEWLDANRADWRDETGMPCWAVQTDKQIRLVPTPVNDGLLLMEGYRLPLVPMVQEDDTPEIHQAHHVHLVQWALHKGFSMPDAEFFDAARASAAEDKFTTYFGLRPDSDLRRITRHDEPHHVEACWP